MESGMDNGRLSKVVADFRLALTELVLSGHWFDNMSIKGDFPRGCCDDSSLLLAAYLHDQGFPGAVRISGAHGGKNEELMSHVWLKLGSQLIDITGSQFENYNQPEILIAEKDEFLDSFQIDPEPRLADFRQSPYVPGYDFNKAYEAILSRIPAR
jgi:hypothetical protein